MSAGKATYYWGIACLAMLVGALAVTNQSLWIDEGSAALKAMEPSLGGWWQNLRSEGNSNLQLLGELFYLWGWEKIFGASEISLRASNIPFYVGGVLALAWGMGRRRPRQTAMVLLALTNAFLWYYLSEARPYIMLFGFAAMSAGCLFRLLAEPEDSLGSRLWYWLFCAGIVGLCATSLIAVPWALGAMAAVVYWSGTRAVLRSARQRIVATSISAALLAGLAAYYLWTLQLGARASGVGRTGLSNVAFIFFEQSGLAGLGPGRLQLRALDAHDLLRYLPLLLLGAVLVLALLTTGARTLRDSVEKRRVLFFLLAVGLPLLLTLAAGVAGHMRLVGRHLTPLLPFLLAWMSLGLTTLLGARVRWRQALGWAALATLLLSALEIRFAVRHQRDDYRDAAAVARQEVADGHRVWWLADLSTGHYYHAPLDAPGVSTASVSPDDSAVPEVVIFSKPDVYDPTGTIRAYLAANRFKVIRELPAFQILRRSPAR